MGQWDLTTNVSNTQSSNAQIFDNCFTNPGCAKDFKRYATNWLDNNEINGSVDININNMQSALARCALFRVDAGTLFRIIQTWRLSHPKENLKSVELPKTINGPIILYGKIEDNDGYVLQEFAPIENMDDFKKIFDVCADDGEVQQYWNVFSNDGCAVIKNTIFVPKPHATNVTAMTFYYIFKALRGVKTSEQTVNVKHAPKGDHEIYFLQEMCHLGLSLAETPNLNVTIKCFVPTNASVTDLNVNSINLSICPADTFRLFFQFLEYLEDTIITLAQDERNLKLLSDIDWAFTGVMQQSKSDSSTFVKLDNELKTDLTSDDFKSMKPGKYLTDNVITKYAKHLQLVAGETQNKEFCHASKSIYIFDTTAGKSFTNGVVPKSFLRSKFKKRLHTYSIFVVPTHIVNGPKGNQTKHWVCFYVLKVNNAWTFYLCDSLIPTLASSTLRTGLEDSLRQMEVIKTSDNVAAKTNTKVLPRQMDGFNCGVYVLHYIGLMLNEKNFGTTDYTDDIDVYIERNDIFSWATFGTFPELTNNEFSVRMKIVLQIFQYLPNDPDARSSIFELTKNGVKVYVKQSTISGAGYGLFAANNIQNETRLLEESDERYDQWGPKIRVTDNSSDETNFKLTNQDSNDETFMENWRTTTNKFITKQWVDFATRWNAYVTKIAAAQFDGDLKDDFEFRHLLQTENVKADPYALEVGTDDLDKQNNIKSRSAFWSNPFNTLVGFINSQKGGLENLKIDDGQLVATRSINPNEELFWDYGLEYVFS